jgi:PAS domain-containing protein
VTDSHALRSDGADRDHAVPSLLTDHPARVLASLPDGVAVVDGTGRIQWANQQFCQWCREQVREGVNLFDALGRPDIEGPDPAPLQAVLAGRSTGETTLRTSDNRYFHLHAAPLDEEGSDEPRLVVAVRDVTHTILEQQKRAAIHQAGQTLADLSPTELADMTVAERIELLKSNIIYYAKDLLQFDVVEIRLLDQQTDRKSVV